MKKLIQGIVEFRRTKRDGLKEMFRKLALGQSPDVLFIACSDSRVVPNLFASTEPGDLFVVRNVGNFIPPCTLCTHTHKAQSEPAALEFALNQLKVKDIVICGHSECGAMLALLNGGQSEDSHIWPWLRNGETALEQLNANSPLLDVFPSEPHNQLSQLNVLMQIKHLYSYPEIQSRVEKKELKLHGWWFDLAHLDVYAYEQKQKRFILMDEEESGRILSEDDPSHIVNNF